MRIVGLAKCELESRSLNLKKSLRKQLRLIITMGYL